jgi:pyruvate dehydrogenase E1 component beta subunit
MELKTLWGMEGDVDTDSAVPLGRANTLREGNHLTLVSWSRQLQACAVACEDLAREGINAELIDLRTIWPWDRDTVLASCVRTGHLLVVHEAVQAGGFGAEIAASAAEATGCRIRRLGAPRIPVGYAPVLEAQSRIGPEDVISAARAMLK